ncbi:MAG TPA: serine hydrolase domain-containing protein [Steroidobacteraceae bacterium]|nr:serine hydrolase domain-containing protein [Steroidobacteraceae bacterium]
MGAVALLSLLTSAALWAGQPSGFASIAPVAAGFSAERLGRLDAYMKRQVQSGHVPGAVTLLARHGKIVAFDTYGEADSDRHTPMAKDAIFRIYSQTKVVTGVALMMLFEEGKWHFDDPVTRFVPEFKSLRVFKGLNADGSMQLEDIGRPPTMRELLTHSAGFGYGLSADTAVDKAYAEANFMAAPSTQEAIARIAKLPLMSQPGVHWSYSAAADIQGYIVERIAGQSLSDFLQTRLFTPLRMNDTGFYVPASKNPRFVPLKAYDAATKSLTAPSGVLVFDYSHPPGTASGGAGLVSTASDYLRFAQMLLNGGELDGVRILAPATVRLLASNHLAEDIRAKHDEPFAARTGVGFGVDVAVILDPAKAGTLRGEGSYDWGGAAGTWFWIDPKNDLIFIGMIQVMNRWQDPQLQKVDAETAALVYGALVNPAR